MKILRHGDLDLILKRFDDPDEIRHMEKGTF